MSGLNELASDVVLAILGAVKAPREDLTVREHGLVEIGRNGRPGPPAPNEPLLLLRVVGPTTEVDPTIDPEICSGVHLNKTEEGSDVLF